MELSQIRYFLEVAQTQHVTKSAQKLHIAQPALSQAIRRLERELGVPLFVARGRNIILTEYGRYLQQKLAPLIAALDDIPGQLKTMAKLESETIHLNVLAASALIAEAIVAYKQTHAELHFQFLQNAENELYDISVCTQPNLPKEIGPDQFVLTEKIFLAVPSGGPFQSLSSVRLADMKDAGFISLYSRTLRFICDGFCRQAGFKPKIAFESDNPSTVRSMIAANMGIGFWPEFTWGRLDTDRVRLLEIEDVPCARSLIFARKHNKIDSAAVDDFFDFLRAYAGGPFKNSAGGAQEDPKTV